MVANVGKVLAGDWAYVENDIRAVVAVGKKHTALTKVIFETDFVTSDADKMELCRVCERAGADFVKTSTGFGFVKQADGQMATRGATDHDVALMKASCGIAVKASGGIRSLADAERLVALGATRLGTSATAAIAAAEAARASGKSGEVAASTSSY
ncbi:MAG: deoxyribose-phosphate aldolase [Pirellulales bacterium]